MSPLHPCLRKLPQTRMLHGKSPGFLVARLIAIVHNAIAPVRFCPIQQFVGQMDDVDRSIGLVAMPRNHTDAHGNHFCRLGSFVSYRQPFQPLPNMVGNHQRAVDACLGEDAGELLAALTGRHVRRSGGAAADDLGYLP